MIRQILFDNKHDYREKFANASHPFCSLILSILLFSQRKQYKLHVIPYSLPMEHSPKNSTHATSIFLSPPFQTDLYSSSVIRYLSGYSVFD